MKKKTTTRGVGTSNHHQAPHVCALWHEVTKRLSLVIVTIIVIVMMSYLLMMKLCKKILNLLKFALVNKRSLKIKRKTR